MSLVHCIVVADVVALWSFEDNLSHYFHCVVVYILIGSWQARQKAGRKLGPTPQYRGRRRSCCYEANSHYDDLEGIFYSDFVLVGRRPRDSVAS
jgi:hypothetical protein